MKIIHAIILLLALLFPQGTAQAKGHGIEIVNHTNYVGSLSYLDYSSQRVVSIPMSFDISTSADNKHIIIDKIFSDPGYKVYSLTVMSFIGDGKIVDTDFANDEISSQTFEVVDIQARSADNWLLVRKTKAKDGNKDANVTITEQMVDGIFSSETRVDYLHTKKNENLRRNWSVATKNNKPLKER